MSFYKGEPLDGDLDGAPEDEQRFACSCGDPSCIGVGDNPGNIRIGKSWYAESCAMAQRLNLIADGRESASRADVRRDDDFNDRRR